MQRTHAAGKRRGMRREVVGWTGAGVSGASSRQARPRFRPPFSCGLVCKGSHSESHCQERSALQWVVGDFIHSFTRACKLRPRASMRPRTETPRAHCSTNGRDQWPRENVAGTRRRHDAPRTADCVRGACPHRTASSRSARPEARPRMPRSRRSFSLAPTFAQPRPRFHACAISILTV